MGGAMAAAAPSSSESTARATALLKSLPPLPRHRAAPEITEESLRPQQQRLMNRHTKTYVALHDTDPPASQVVRTATQNVLLRQFHARAEKRKNGKRPVPDAKDERPAKR